MYKLRCDLDELSSYFYKSIYGVINKNTLINVSKYLHDSGKGYRTIAKLLNAEGSRTAKNKGSRTQMFMQSLNDMQKDKHV